MVRFHKRYFLLAVCLFAVEVAIALYMHDRIIRPYVGDYLVVMLLYCAVKALLDFSVMKTALCVLAFSCLIELSQYFQLVSRLGLQHNRLARVVLGASFQWIDLVAYACGIATILIMEKMVKKRANTESHLAVSKADF